MKRAAPGAADPASLDEIKACIEKRLFIGRLPGGATDEEVREIYSTFGALKECKVLPEKGVAFVGYDTWAAAHRALLTTDGQACLRSCNGQPISVAFAERSGSAGRGAQYAKGMEHSRIFVGGLPETCTDADLKQLFDVFGKVEAANLLAPKGNRRCGFVNFALWGEALDAIELLDGQRYPGSYGDDRRGPGSEAMTVVLASPREGGGSKVRRLDGVGTELALPALDDGRPVGDPEYESLKVAYLAAVDGDTPARICDELHRKIMASRPATRQLLAIAPSLAQNTLLGNDPMPLLSSGCEERDAARLFIGGLPYECTDEELRALVDQVQFTLSPVQCQLLECRVLPGRGCGYIRFATWEAAAEAIQALNERAVSGWLTPLRVRWATPKGQAPAGAAGVAGVAGASPQPQDKILQLALQQVVSGTRADSISTALTALLGGADAGAAAQLAANNASVAQFTAAAAAGGLGGMASVGLQDEALVAAQGLDPKRLFVGQLSRELTDKAALTRLFEPFGQIESLRWLEDKGVAYVQYSDFVAANAALATLGGKHIPGISRDQGLNINFSRMR